jgi:hypothetical protein
MYNKFWPTKEKGRGVHSQLHALHKERGGVQYPSTEREEGMQHDVRSTSRRCLCKCGSHGVLFRIFIFDFRQKKKKKKNTTRRPDDREKIDRKLMSPHPSYNGVLFMFIFIYFLLEGMTRALPFRCNNWRFLGAFLSFISCRDINVLT